MIKADQYYIDNLNQILNEMNEDKNPRPSYKDGTPAHSYYITQVFEKYDLTKGEFPITTLRNTAIKGGIGEMLAIYQNQTNTQTGFEKYGVGWWLDWMNEDGNIGRAYSHNIESHRPNEMNKSIVKISPKKVKSIFLKKKKIKIKKIKKEYISKIGKYILLKEDKKNRKYQLQSLETGEIQTVCYTSYKKLKSGNDSFLSKNSPFLFDRNYYNVGYMGNVDGVNNFSDNDIFVLKRKWTAMLKRCYSKDTHYNTYKNVFVHQDWHDFSKFLTDIRFVPQYHLAKEQNFEGWELDKDYFDSNCYSKDTCVFLHTNENKLYNKSSLIKVTHPNGKEEKIINLKKFCNDYDLSSGNAHSVMVGSRNHCNGFKFSSIEDRKHVYRYEVSRNQINNLLKNLKENPFGRRNIISFWNWSNIDKKELVECAYETVWTVRENKGIKYIDMTLIQRSQDAIMATYINKIQYVALQMMVACHLGYEVGTFAHFIQNYHIYDRHLEACQELLERKPLKFQPKIKLKCKDKTNFYNIKLEDFEIITSSDIKKLNSELEIAV